MTKRLLALLGAAVLVISACTPAAQQASPTAATGESAAPGASASAGGEQLAADQVFRAYVSDTDPETLTPYHAQDAVSIAVLNAVHRGLLYSDKDLNIVPAAAEALPEVTDNGQTMTFKIRDGAVYADGSPIVGADFVRAFRQLADPRLANPYGYIVCPVVGVDATLGVDQGCGSDPTPKDPAAIDAALDKLGVEAPDDKTVVFHLTKPVAGYFAAVIGTWLIVPIKEEWIGPDGTLTEDAIVGGASSGPFKIDHWDHGSEILLVPNDKWYGDTKPTLTEYHIMIGGPLEQAWTSYQRGDLDVVQVTGTAIVHEIDDDASLKPEIKDTPSLSISYYDFANCQDPSATSDNPKCPAASKGATKDGKPPTTNKNFRIALTQAIDKQEFINVTYGGLGKPASSMVMPGLPGYDESYDPYPFDVESATQHMATAIQELGTTDTNGDKKVDAKDLGTLSFGYNCNAGHQPRVTYLAEHWRSVFDLDEGKFDISCSDFPVFLKERPNGKYMISRDGWNADFAHAQNQLDNFICGGGNNNAQYCNPEFDKAMDAAAAEPDPAKQGELYKAAQKILVDDAPVIFLRFATTRWMAKTYVGGLQITSSDSENPGDRLPESIKILAH